MIIAAVSIAAAATLAGAGAYVADRSAPNATTLQLAYERETARGDKRHDANLQIMSSECSADRPGSFVCWIRFISRSDPAQRLYFDAISVSKRSGEWRLESGLCKS